MANITSHTQTHRSVVSTPPHPLHLTGISDLDESKVRYKGDFKKQNKKLDLTIYNFQHQQKNLKIYQVINIDFKHKWCFILWQTTHKTV